MRVLIINSMFTSAVYRRCADELGRIPGVELTVLTVDHWLMNGGRMGLDPVSAGAPYKLVTGRAVWRGKENRGFYRSGLMRAIRQARPEVIYLMEEPFSFFALEVMLARSVVAPGVPVVNFTWNNLSLREYDYRPSFAYHTISKWVLPRVSYALTANTDGIAVLRSEGFDRPIQTLGYGVDVSSFLSVDPAKVQVVRKDLGLSTDDVVISYVGRMKWMKGLDLLLEAFAEVSKSDATGRLKLLLIGSGEDREAILARSTELGIADRIRAIPSVPHQEIPLYMHALDILVLPSRRVGMWAEQFGRVLVEAMACGKIVIGSTSGAIPEVIGQGGFTFPENDAAGLAQVLQTALTLSATERTELRERAIRRATDDFSWAKFARLSHEALKSVTRLESHKEVAA